MAPNIAMPESKPVAAAARTIGLRKSPRGMRGWAARRSTRTKAASSTAEAISSPTTGPRGHQAPAPPSREPQQQGGARARKQQRARMVEDHGPARGWLVVEPPGDGPGSQETERDVDVEDPAPRHGVGEDTAEQRPPEGGHAPDAPEVPPPLRPALEIA